MSDEKEPTIYVDRFGNTFRVEILERGTRVCECGGTRLTCRAATVINEHVDSVFSVDFCISCGDGMEHP